MPHIRRLDHISHGSSLHFGRRQLIGGKIHYRHHFSGNGGMIHNLRFHRHGRGWFLAGHGVRAHGGALPESETIPTPYNVQLPGGRMKRPSRMTKEHVIAKMRKLEARS